MLVEIKELRKTFDNGTKALQGVNLSVNEGEFVVVLGASGIVILMIAALITHIKIKNSISKMLPAFSLMLMSSAILLGTI